MRVPLRHKGTEDREEASAKPRKNDEGEKEEEELVVSKSHPKPLVLVSGAIANLERDFPTAAVKHMHEKPLPTKDPRPVHHTSTRAAIQQPRREQSKKIHQKVDKNHPPHTS